LVSESDSDGDLVSDSQLVEVQVKTFDKTDQGKDYVLSSDLVTVEHSAYAWRTVRAGPWVGTDTHLKGTFETVGFGVVGVVSETFDSYNNVMGWDPNSWGYHAYTGAMWHNNAKICDALPFLSKKFKITMEVKHRVVSYTDETGNLLYSHKLPKCGKVALAMSSLAYGSKARILS